MYKKKRLSWNTSSKTLLDREEFIKLLKDCGLKLYRTEYKESSFVKAKYVYEKNRDSVISILKEAVKQGGSS